MHACACAACAEESGARCATHEKAARTRDEYICWFGLHDERVYRRKSANPTSAGGKAHNQLNFPNEINTTLQSAARHVQVMEEHERGGQKPSARRPKPIPPAPNAEAGGVATANLPIMGRTNNSGTQLPWALAAMRMAKECGLKPVDMAKALKGEFSHVNVEETLDPVQVTVPNPGIVAAPPSIAMPPPGAVMPGVVAALPPGVVVPAMPPGVVAAIPPGAVGGPPGAGAGGL